VRHFASEGLELFVSQSFGKNMSLYGERIGFLSGVVADPGTILPILSQLTLTVRPMVRSPLISLFFFFVISGNNLFLFFMAKLPCLAKPKLSGLA
jgi:hypothetical protein